jgi:hypothetical protein
MGIGLRDEVVRMRTGTKRVLVAQPEECVVIDRAMIDARRHATGMSKADASIFAALNRHPYDVLVFQGGDGEGGTRFELSQDITAARLADAGSVLVRGQLGVYRGLARYGAIVLVNAEMGEREIEAFRDGTGMVIDQIEAKLPSAPNPRELNLDLWLLRHMAIYSSLSLESVLTQLLPNQLPMLETRASRIQKLL